MLVYLGVDDTDSIESRGTGFRSRQMGSELALARFGKVLGITRHQLFVHPQIPYTSQNSSNCLEIVTEKPEGLWEFCKTFLLREALPGSDVGICMAQPCHINKAIEDWGKRAKTEVLSLEEVDRYADQETVFLEGLTGSFDGKIGALAAIGLRNAGNDGRFIWQPGKQLRDVQGSVTVDDLLRGTQVDHVMTTDGKILGRDELIDLTDWVRAVLINKSTYILAEKNLKKSGNDWKTADKAYIKNLSS